MEDKMKTAEELFRQGFNCSQAVFAAFSEECGIDRETALKLASSFGGGMGKLREVCGAVTGMFMAAGLIYGYSDPKDAQAKAEHYRRIQEFAEKFRAENGSIVCRELLGLPKGLDTAPPEARTPSYYKKRPCVQMVRCAAKIMQAYLKENKIG